MVKCSFCGKTIEPGTGSIYVYKSGKQIHLCSSKCRKNLLKLKRKSIHTRWTKNYQK